MDRWLGKEQVYARDYKDDEEDLSLFPDETLGVDNILEEYEEVKRIPSESWYIHSLLFFNISIII